MGQSMQIDGAFENLLDDDITQMIAMALSSGNVTLLNLLRGEQKKRKQAEHKVLKFDLGPLDHGEMKDYNGPYETKN